MNYQPEDRKPDEQDRPVTDNRAENVRSYVYPEQRIDQGGQPPAPIPSNTGRAKTIGFIAWTLALVILFSALSGGLVYSYMRDRANPRETTQLTEPADRPDQTDPSTAETDPAPAGSTQTDKHFSLEEAASRRDENKQTLSVMEIAEQGKAAVVAITTQMTVTDFFGQVGRVPSAGSGFIITDDGYIVTNNHVVRGAVSITVVLDQGDAYEARLVGTDQNNDIAVLKIEADHLPTVFLGDSADVQVGELAVAIGNPLGELSNTVTAGVISGLDREITIDGQTLRLLQTDAAINSGNSGGALFNSFGEVIGINTAKSSGTGIEGLGFAIPISHAAPIIESLIQNGYVAGRPKIGISTREISAQMAEYYDLVEGVLVAFVEPGSSADEAGVRRGDIVIKTNGIETLTTDKINEIKNQLQPGDELVLTVVRDGETLELTLVLKEDVPAEVKPATYRSGSGIEEET